MSRELNEVLRTVNVARVAAGLEALAALPKGIPWDAQLCPLGKALCGARVFENGINFDESDIQDIEKVKAIAEALDVDMEPDEDEEGYHQCVIGTPWFWRSFIADFDHREYPELIAEA